MPAPDDRPTVTAIVVAYGSEPWLEKCVRAVLDSADVAADVIVVDNGCTDGATDRLEGESGVRVVRPGRNTGFSEGCNIGAEQATGTFVALVNPDCIPDPLAMAALSRVAARPDVAIATASIRLADAPELLNSAGNELHCTGVGWSGHFREPAALHDQERPACTASGAGMVMRRDRWQELRGFEPTFFAYYEDADLSVRAWQHGYQVVYVPDAVMVHRYEFSRRPEKYFLLERNRLLLVLTCYERRTILWLAPLLIAVEVGFLALSIAEGWWRQKLRSWAWLVRHRRDVVAIRTTVQSERRCGDEVLVPLFSDDLLPGNYPHPPGWPIVNRAVRSYWRLVKDRL